MPALTAAQAKQFQDLFTVVGTAFVTTDPAAPAAGDQVDISVTVPGAALGDHVWVALGVSPQNLAVTAGVTAANTVVVKLNANNGATTGANLAAVNARVVVVRLNPNYF